MVTRPEWPKHSRSEQERGRGRCESCNPPLSPCPCARSRSPDPCCPLSLSHLSSNFATVLGAASSAGSMPRRSRAAASLDALPPATTFARALRWWASTQIRISIASSACKVECQIPSWHGRPAFFFFFRSQRFLSRARQAHGKSTDCYSSFLHADCSLALREQSVCPGHLRLLAWPHAPHPDLPLVPCPDCRVSQGWVAPHCAALLRSRYPLDGSLDMLVYSLLLTGLGFRAGAARPDLTAFPARFAVTAHLIAFCSPRSSGRNHSHACEARSRR